MDLSRSHCNSTSRKGSLPSDSLSTVNWMLDSTPFRWLRNSCNVPARSAVHVSSTYRFQKQSRILLLSWVSLPHLPSPGWQSSLKPVTAWLSHRSVGTPILGRPGRWQKGRTPGASSLPPRTGRWVLQGSHSLAVCVGLLTLLRRSTGTFVKSETTSKEARISSSWRTCEWIKFC